jgi:MFS family permease
MTVTQRSSSPEPLPPVEILAPLGPPKQLGVAEWMVLAAAFLGWMFDGLEMGLFPIAGRSALIDLMQTHDEALIFKGISYLMALFLLGAATGGVIFGWMGDKIGRVRSMTISILTYSGFMGLCFFAQAPWQLGGFLFCAALGMGGEWGLGVALVMECWPERLRPRLAIAIGAASNVGFLLISLVGILHHITPDHWRWIMLAGASPGVLGILVILFVPESQRWKRSVRKGAANPLREIFRPPLLKSTLLAVTLCSVALIGTWAAVSAFMPAWADKLVGKVDPYAKAKVQLVAAFGCIIGCMIGPPLSNRIGRRGAYFALCVGSLAVTQTFFRVPYFRLAENFNALFLVMAGLAGFTASSFYGFLPLYLPELYPTRVRSTGQGVSFNSGRVLAAMGVLFAGWLVGSLGGYPQVCSTITLIYLVGMVVIWFAPETMGKPLPE